MLHFQTCYHSHLNVSQNTKTNINVRIQVWARPLAKCQVKGFILPHKYLAQFSTKDFGMLQLTQNAKSDNSIVGYHLVSRHVISTPSDVQSVCRFPKKTFILPRKHHSVVSNMLSQPLKCVIKKKTNINFKDQNW